MSDPVYARWWFKQYGLYTMDRVFFLGENRWRIAEQAEAHEGFDAALRTVALEALSADDWLAARKALSALAVVGRDEDIGVIEAAGKARGGDLGKDARTAAYEIKHRPAATERADESHYAP